MESASPEGEGCRPCCVPPTLMKRLRQTCHLMFLPTYQHRFTTRPSRSRTSQVLPSLTPLHMPLPTEVTQASRTRRLILITTTCITSPCPVCPECHCRPFVDLNFDFFCPIYCLWMLSLPRADLRAATSIVDPYILPRFSFASRRHPLFL